MDPFIEACDLWEDFHDDLIAEIKRVLAPGLPEGYVARTGKRCYEVLVDTEGKSNVRPWWPWPPGGALAAPAAPGEARSMRAFIELDYEEKFIDIYELKPERRLVTSIEILSPSNKKRRSVGWKKYLRKRQALLLGKANLVELDLLRGGERMPMLDPWPESPYTLLVAREEAAPNCRVWPASFDQPLPVLPIPLSRPDPDISLALQPLLEAIYARGRYAQDIDYTRPLAPPLSKEEAVRVKQLLRASPQAEPSPSSRKRRPRQG
jgi:hypothetical protein